MSPLDRIRAICLALPETNERLSHGSPTFFIRDTTTFTSFHDVDRHKEQGPTIWCPAPSGVQEQMVEAEPERFYRPPYVGGRGWLGVRLDVEPDWDEVAGMIEEAFLLVAPKKLAVSLRNSRQSAAGDSPPQ